MLEEKKKREVLMIHKLVQYLEENYIILGVFDQQRVFSGFLGLCCCFLWVIEVGRIIPLVQVKIALRYLIHLIQPSDPLHRSCIEMQEQNPFFDSITFQTYFPKLHDLKTSIYNTRLIPRCEVLGVA